MRVVVDTNVFVSSFFGGNSRKVIDLWKGGDITLCLSNAIVDEYIDVLVRMELLAEEELAELFRLFRAGPNCLFTAKTPSLRVSADPDDDKFVETAVALEAECVVTGDEDLLVLKQYLGIRILKPRTFLGAYAPRR